MQFGFSFKQFIYLSMIGFGGFFLTPAAADFDSFSPPDYWTEDKLVVPEGDYQTAEVTLTNAWTTNEDSPKDLRFVLGFRNNQCVTAWLATNTPTWFRPKETTLKMESGKLTGTLVASMHAVGEPTIQYDFDAAISGSEVNGTFSGVLKPWPEYKDGQIEYKFENREVSGDVNGKVCNQNCLEQKNSIGPSFSWASYRGPHGTYSGAHSGVELVENLDMARLAWKSEEVFGPGFGSAPDMRYGPFRPLEGNIGSGASTPVYHNGVLYFYYFQPSSDQTGVEAARDKWQSEWNSYYPDREIPTRTLDMSKKFADDVIVAMDAKSGKTLWKRVIVKATNNIQTHKWRNYNPTPLVNDGIVYVENYTGALYALDVITGEILWQHPSNGEITDAGPKLAGDYIVRVAREYAENPDQGSMRCFFYNSRTGAIEWEWFDERYKEYLPFAWKSGGKDYLLVLQRDNQDKEEIVLLDLEEQAEIWRDQQVWTLDQSTLNYPLLAGDYLVTIQGGQPQGTITCYQITLEGITEKWSQPAPEDMRANYALTILNGKIYINSETVLQSLELKTGKLIDEVTGFGGARTQHSFSGNGRLFLQRDGRHGTSTLQTVDISSNVLRIINGADDLWHPPQPHTTSYAYQPIRKPLVDGRLFFRGNDGIYCYDLRTDQAASIPGNKINPPADRPAYWFEFGDRFDLKGRHLQEGKYLRYFSISD